MSRLPGTVAVAVAVGVLVLAGCGGGSTSASASTGTYAKALAYAECMRTHGEPAWPDPNSQGLFTGIGSANLVTGRVMVSAMEACLHLDPPAPLSKAQEQQNMTKMLAYSECMRSHGVTNYPDPTVAAGGRGLLPAFPPGVDVNSPQYTSAVHACENE